ncbi:unnamed protein product, partial [Prorocentrum cordatum]
DLAMLNAQKKRKKDPRIARLPLMVFADNFYLLASSAQMLRAMWTEWHRILRQRFACTVLLSDCFWLTTAKDSAATLRLEE